jgi:hypothetical protein
MRMTSNDPGVRAIFFGGFQFGGVVSLSMTRW